MVWVVIGFIIFQALWVGICFGVHAYDAGTSQSRRPAVYRYVFAWFNETFSHFRVALTYPLGWLPSLPDRPFNPDGGPPILLVHGYLVNRACLWTMYWRLRKSGFRNVYTVNLWPPFGTIETISQGLRRRIYEVSRRCQGHHIVLVCHSMGGLVARHVASTDQHLPVVKIVSIGTPYGGTRLARTAWGHNAKQMRRGAAFLSAHGPVGIPTVSIYSEMDNIIIPAESAAYGSRKIAMRHVGHVALLHSRQVMQAVAEELVALPLKARLTG